jgi:hypothetical protein
MGLKLDQSLSVLEITVLRRTFGSKREEVAGGLRKLHDEELHKSYPSPVIVTMIKSWMMTRARFVACTG